MTEPNKETVLQERKYLKEKLEKGKIFNLADENVTCNVTTEYNVEVTYEDGSWDIPSQTYDNLKDACETAIYMVNSCQDENPKPVHAIVTHQTTLWEDNDPTSLAQITVACFLPNTEEQ